MTGKPIDDIRELIQNGQFIVSRKVQDKLYLGQMTHEQIRSIASEGTVSKKEPDEETEGLYTKFTIIWRDWYLVVKNSDPCFIITAGESD